ncbi:MULTISPECIES: thrombospondin type 3 repeat-containing protein [Salegentibacter]|uniref:Thrombospondin type 3 repeat-containing protein n=1 Tax=Salegentibacter flavus TaxID=287099 RepID=A0A1I5A8D6_9FLAO|nr:hypothetical protein SAMN05660413_01735 [Salegentibacter flavus]
MKNFNKYIGAIAIIAMLFTSCSKEETDVLQDEAKATLSFGTVLNDLVNNSKQQADLGIPVCVDDEPAYVEVVLTGDEGLGSMEEPLVINVNPTPIQEDGEDVWFTEESADLELTPGDYVLTYFAVFNEGGDRIWLAPTMGGDLDDFVDNPLPLDISLGAGVKKYVDVEVLCFDDRMVNEYGYLFFDIIGKEAFEFCVFANYCDENGRHYPAYYSFEVYMGTDDSGDLLYNELLYPVPSTDGEDPSVAPLCFALPNPTNLDGDVPYIYWRATLEDWDAVYGEAPEMVLDGTLTRNAIMSLLNDDGETAEYAHLRFGCDDDNGGGNGGPQDSDGDGIPDSQDNCPNLANPDQDPDADCDGIIDAEEAEGCVNNPDPTCGAVVIVPCLPDPDTTSNCETTSFSEENVSDQFPYQLLVDGTEVGNVAVSVNGSGDVIIEITMNIANDAYLVDETEVIIGDYIECFNFDNEGTATMTIEGDYTLGFDLDMRVNVCPAI